MSSDENLSARVGDPRMVLRVFDQLPALVVVSEGRELRIVAATARYRAYAGRQDMVGRTMREVFPEALGQQIFQNFERVYVNGQPERVTDFRAQFVLPETGQLVEAFIDLSVDPMVGAGGDVEALIIEMVDVTEQVGRQRAQQRRVVEAERRYEQARDVIDTLQRELLPVGVPVLPRLRMAASYLLADGDSSAGGDWFDVVPLADGRVALMVGDVVGHGVSASATMGQLRVLLHHLVSVSGDIASALTGLNGAAEQVRGARSATVCVVVLDPVTGRLQYCTAGHPQPLVVSAAGISQFLPVTGAGPIGVGGVFTQEMVAEHRLDEGETILLYSDGIVERPGRAFADSMVELAEVAADVVAGRAFRDDEGSPADRVCSQLLELLVRITGHDDDITVLAGYRTEPPEPLRLTLDRGDADLQQKLRSRLSDWLGRCGADAHDDAAIRHAVGEVVTNSLEHAYPDQTGTAATCELVASLRPDGRVEVHVRDHGKWREPQPSAERGLGLQIAGGLVEQLRVRHDETGTVVTLEHSLTRRARLLTAGQSFSAPAGPRFSQADPFLIIEQPWAPAPRIRIDGPVNAATAVSAETAIRAAGSSATTDLTVDLTGVTHLASAGVAAFHRLVAAHHANSTRLWWYAPTGTPADIVLTLVGIDHLTQDPHTPPC